MSNRSPMLLVGAAGALLLALMAFLTMRAPETGPPISPQARALDPSPPGAAGRGARGSRSTPAAADPAADPADAEAGTAVDPADVPLGWGLSAASEAGVDDAPEIRPREVDLDREQVRVRSPESAAEAIRIEEAVLGLLSNVVPELDGGEIDMACSDDGRTCTFEGPWVGDDFLARWVEKISDGQVSNEDLDGVVFRTFEPVEVDGEKRFRTVAVSP